MFRSLFPFRRLLATSFLLVFVNVFVGQCWCATINPVQAAPAPVAQTAASKKPTHPGCHGHGKALTQQQPVKTKQGHGHSSSKPMGKEDCCKDNSATILKSLATPGEKQLLSPAPALLPVSNEFFFRPAAGAWDRTHSVVLVLREHLPPKIPDIRIFIQSLTV
ncbi:hypothetical protein LRS06_24420 [Hymenobacter sp. J193]|uniref:hypothetical protein n=1 Tax=Hymenobacter sp. J193 TaxID=2898429 RepID=UPI002150C9AB|nr:hypothetical protein [Hymenobacter sp. J193]MCR5890767.1 hypothetical protein [Hymenobacter sp. J193]MCR5890873.1 hypothetical protein [Hymenobacter sp. J193]